MTFFRAAACAALVATAGIIGGCNIFESFIPEANEVDKILQDARHARSSGNLDRAVTLLTKALGLEPSNPVVRYELAFTLMRREKLDLMSLERVVSHLLSARSGHAARATAEGLCTFDTRRRAEPFDPRDLDGFEAIAAARPTLKWVLELLNDPSSPTEAPAMPAEFTSLDICEVITPDGLRYNRQQVLDALYNQFETEHQVTGALSTNAIALTLASYVNLFEQPDLRVDWFIVDGEDLGACIDESDYDLLVERAIGEVRRAGRALLAVDLLLEHAGNTSIQKIVDDALRYYHTFKIDEFNPCADPA